MSQVISGKDLSMTLKDEMKNQVAELVIKYGRAPHLVVILVGENPSSISYVKGKSVACEYIGIQNTTIRLSDTITEVELLETIAKLNQDPLIDGILVQLPLPKHINESKVIEAIDILKDVDGFHPLNVANLWLKKPSTLPCTPKGIIKLLDQTGVKIAGLKAVVIGRSNIVGLPIAKLLLDRDATVTICHSKTKNLAEVTKEADLLIVAIGRARFVTKDMVKPGAIVIDVGVNRDENGVLCGDVDFNEVVDLASFITKVPGGVGPMTITCLMENTIEAFLKKVGA